MPKTPEKNTSQDVTVETSCTCLETASVLHKTGTGRPDVSAENVEGIWFSSAVLHVGAAFARAAAATKTFAFVFLELASAARMQLCKQIALIVLWY